MKRYRPIAGGHLPPGYRSLSGSANWGAVNERVTGPKPGMVTYDG